MSRFHGHEMWNCRLAITVVIGVGLFSHGRQARAEQFMGCELNRLPNQILRCLDDKRRDWEADRQRELDAAVQRAKQRAREDADKLANQLEKEGKLVKTEGERVLLGARRTLQVEPLVACLVGANPRLEATALAARFAADPQAFLKTAYDDAVAILPGIKFVAPRIDATARPPTPTEIFDATWARLDLLAARSPTVRCAVEYLRSRQQAMRRAFLDVSPRLITMVGGAWKATGESVLASVLAKVVSAGLNKTALGADGVLILKGALTEHMLGPDRIQSNADLVHVLAAAIPQGGAPLTDAARKAKDALSTSAQIDADFYVDLFGTWLKVAGHNLIRSDRPPGPGLPGGGWLADRLLDQLDWLPGEVNAMIGSICGLVPEVGGVTCAWAFKLSLRELWVSIGRPALKDASLTALEVAYDTGADLLKDKLRRVARNGVAQLRQQAGVFAPLLEGMHEQLVIGFVDDVVKNTRVALDKYNHSVIELVEAAVAGH